MSLNIVKLHQLIDQWAADERAKEQTPETPVEATVVPEAPKPEGKRVVRTKTSGDTVYFIDEVKKTRQRIVGSNMTPGPDIVESLGFQMGDVGEMDDTEMAQFQQGAPIYKVDAES